MPIQPGTNFPSRITLGSTTVSRIMYGSTMIWGGGGDAVIWEDFNLAGTLWNWFIDFVTDVAGQIVASVTGLGGLITTTISDQWGQLYNGVGTFVGAISKFVPVIDTSSGNPGIIISQIPQSLTTALCTGVSAVGGWVDTATSGGLVGFLNGLPIIGGAFKWLQEFFADPVTTLTSVVSAIGSMPVIQDLANLMGIVQDAVTGAIADPQNFVTNAIGDVLGVVSCGQFNLHAGGSKTVTYPIGSIGNLGRILIPDGLVSLSPTTGWARSENLTSDDGYLQIGVGSSGNQGEATRVFRRYDESGAISSGVGLHLVDGQVSIDRLVGTTETLVVPAMAPYAPGDDLMLTQVGDVHTAYRNGQRIGEWEDNSRTAGVGVGKRAVGMAMTGSQDLMGPRTFSPALRYVRAA